VPTRKPRGIAPVVEAATVPLDDEFVHHKLFPELCRRSTVAPAVQATEGPPVIVAVEAPAVATKDGDATISAAYNRNFLVCETCACSPNTGNATEWRTLRTEIPHRPAACTRLLLRDLFRWAAEARPIPT
jgi:hypothetical protein